MYSKMSKLSSVVSSRVVLLDSYGNLHCLIGGLEKVKQVFFYSGSSYIMYNNNKYEIDADFLDIRMLTE